MKVRILEIDGTPEEIARSEWLRQVLSAQDAGVAGPPPAGPNAEAPVGMELGWSLIRAVLERIPIPRGQARLYRCLARAGSDGMSQQELADCNQVTRQQLAGVLGALGHRINATPGVTVPEGRSPIEFFLQISEEDGEWRYILRPSVASVLGEIGFKWDA